MSTLKREVVVVYETPTRGALAGQVGIKFRCAPSAPCAVALNLKRWSVPPLDSPSVVATFLGISRCQRIFIQINVGHEHTPRVQAHAIMKLEQTEEEIILAFMVSDEALEDAANTNFSLGNCTEANVCPIPN